MRFRLNLRRPNLPNLRRRCCVPFGWNISVVNRTRGGLEGYSSLKVMRIEKTPPGTKRGKGVSKKARTESGVCERPIMTQTERRRRRKREGGHTEGKRKKREERTHHHFAGEDWSTAAAHTFERCLVRAEHARSPHVEVVLVDGICAAALRWWQPARERKGRRRKCENHICRRKPQADKATVRRPSVQPEHECRLTGAALAKEGLTHLGGVLLHLLQVACQPQQTRGAGHGAEVDKFH